MPSSQPLRASHAAAGAGRRARAKALFLLPALAAAVSMCGGRSDILLEPGPEAPVPDEPGPDEPGPDEPGPDEPGPDEPGPGCVPAPEVCDLVDNDCDGQTDEGTCPAGTACGVSLAADMASPPEGWSFNGNAFWDADRRSGVLTEARRGQAGTIIYWNPLAADAFTATFEFRLGDGDGMGFMLQTTGETAVGEPGGGLGMAGLAGYGVEIDTYHNLDCTDSSKNHVGVDDLTQRCDAGVLGSLSQGTSGVALGDGAFHTAQIELNQGKVSLIIDGKSQLQGFSIPGFPVGSKFFYGFAAGTGDATARQEIRNVKITFPSPRCL
ncbi:hypothetical protein WMF27_10950 [Sorangium sp. So ce281]|uniref:lectin-like domain-containing protein n=1 Tax=unclassified Sorangium TaxID=2621164 RepID=UPI003F5E884F